MRIYTLLQIVAVSLIPAAAFAWPNVDRIEVGTREVPYQISNGTRTESGVVRYKVYLMRTVNQKGKVSTWSHPIDDRQCEWRVSGHMDREVCFQPIMGGESCNNGWQKTTPVNIPGKSNGLASPLDHDPCSDYTSRINDDTNQAKSALSAALQQLSDQDLDGDLASTMRGRGANVTYARN